MKAKKPAVKTAKKSEKKLAKKQKRPAVNKHCEACMNIRNGLSNSPATTQGKFVHHTCGKTDQQLREFIFNINLINAIRTKLPCASEFDDC